MSLSLINNSLLLPPTHSTNTTHKQNKPPTHPPTHLSTGHHSLRPQAREHPPPPPQAQRHQGKPPTHPPTHPGYPPTHLLHSPRLPSTYPRRTVAHSNRPLLLYPTYPLSRLAPHSIELTHPPFSSSSSLQVIDFGSSCKSNKRMYSYIQSRFYRSPEVMLGYVPPTHPSNLPTHVKQQSSFSTSISPPPQPSAPHSNRLLLLYLPNT